MKRIIAESHKRKRRVQPERQPLLVIDGDSFAHRAYHALPKNSSPRRKRRSSIRCAPARWRGSGPNKCANVMASNPSKCRISSRCAAIPPTNCQELLASARSARRLCFAAIGSLTAILKAARFARIADDLRLYREIATMNKKAPLPSLARQKPTFAKAAALARQWQLRQLAGRLEEVAKNVSASATSTLRRSRNK